MSLLACLLALALPTDPLIGPLDLVVTTDSSGSGKLTVIRPDHAIETTIPIDTSARAVAFAPDGSLVAVSKTKLRRFDLDLAVIDTVADGTLLQPNLAAFGPDGLLYVVNANPGNAVHVYDRDLQLVTKVTDAAVQNPSAIAFGPDGRFYVTSPSIKTVVAFEPGGKRAALIADPALVSPMGLAFGPDGLLYVADALTEEIHVFDPATLARVKTIECEGDVFIGLAFGPDGNFYTGSFFPTGVRVLDPKGKLVAFVATDLGPDQIAFAPQRLPVRIAGDLTDAAGSFASIDEVGTLLHAPGSMTAMLALEPGIALSQALDVEQIVATGLVVAPSAKARRGAFFQCPTLPQSGVVASLQIQMKGKRDADAFFRVETFAGNLQLQGADFNGSLTIAVP